MWDGERYKKTLISALKISVGSCLAIYIAASLNLEFATSAGSITLLTILTTKWDTLKPVSYTHLSREAEAPALTTEFSLPA